MTIHKLHVRQSYTTLTKLTMIGLVCTALAFASELIWLGDLDREISIVVACLVAGAALLATGWRWTPLVGVVLAGGLFFGNPFLLYNLSQPITNPFFFSALAEVIGGVLVVVAGVGALLQNYRNTQKERVMRMQRITLVVLLTYLWAMMILLGSLVLESFMIYPNIFYNAPERFGIALQFFSVTDPAQYFRPFGMASVILGVIAALASWRIRPVRWWVVASVLMILCEGVSSILFFWPRNTVLFVEGAVVHSVEVLRQTAQEFQLWHWSRLAFNAASAVFAFVGFLRFYRYTITCQTKQS